MNFPSSATTYIRIIVIIIFFGLVGVFQGFHDDLSPPFTTKLKLAKRNLLPEQILPFINFGFSNMVADYYWISAIQDFVAWNGKEGFFIGYFRNISTLDPRFEYPYLFNILTIPDKKNVAMLDDIAHIAERGLQAIPTSWKLPFYLGTQYYIFTKNYYPAEDYLKLAATKKNAPDGVYLLYATFVGRDLYTTEQKQGFAVKLIKTIYNNTDNEIIKKLAAQGIQEHVVNQFLEKGIIAYKERYKRYPKNVEEMISVHLITLPEEFLSMFTVEISKRDGSFKIVEKE